jgi:transposase-like protein
MVLDEGRLIVEVADAIRVKESTLRSWVGKARRERSAGEGLNADERAELDEMRAECAQLRMERESHQTIDGLLGEAVATASRYRCVDDQRVAGFPVTAAWWAPGALRVRSRGCR